MLYKMIFFVLIPFSIYSQDLSIEDAERYIQDLIWQKGSFNSWSGEETITAANRLGIRYNEVKYKQLISYDIDDRTREMIKHKQLGYSIIIDTLDGEYSRITLKLDNNYGIKQYYFKFKHYISPFTYLTKHWTVIESEHFRFIISDTLLFNRYSIDKLESFLQKTASLLDIRKQELNILKNKKIYYILCKDEDEIQKLTGFRTRGIYNLAFDAIVTAFNTHYHELAHLLINYKLHKLPLYTHPLLQEGFAVAYGGRGGIEPEVILPVGNFLFSSQFVELSDLLSKDNFGRMDASVSYPAAGLFTKFLIDNNGINEFLKLYNKHSGKADDPQTALISPAELPDNARWRLYLPGNSSQRSITLDSPCEGAKPIIKDSLVEISEYNSSYYLSIKGSILLKPGMPIHNYTSKKFSELFPANKYTGEKYYISVTPDDISIYNLYTNNLTASYTASFSIPPKTVDRTGDKYTFVIHKNIFEERLDSLQFIRGY